MSGANVWLFAASPALFFYTGHQWDMAAIGITALAVLALQRGREGWGIAGLVIATSLKLFPVVFVAAAVVERIRDRRYRSAAGMSLAFAAGTLAINLPVALLNFEGWSFFFRWNRDRLADSGIWVLWRGVPTEDLTRWSAVAALAGGIALSALVFRSRGPIMIPLGATYLLWWLLVNKTFTTHLMLWAFLSLALLSAPWWLWGLTAATDLVGFQARQLSQSLQRLRLPERAIDPKSRRKHLRPDADRAFRRAAHFRPLGHACLTDGAVCERYMPQPWRNSALIRISVARAKEWSSASV